MSEEIRKVRFNAKYIAVLAEFMGKKDVRYYLNGAFVTPHKDQGVVLAATDGHTMVVIHDSEGETNGDHIFSISKEMISASKKRMSSLGKPEAVELIGEVAYVRQFKSDLAYDPEIVSMDIHVEHCPPIDGKYPDIKRVIPTGEPEPSIITLNPLYMARIDRASRAVGKKECGASFYTYGEEKSAVVRVPGMDEVLFIIMAMSRHACDGNPIEQWLRSYVDDGKAA